MIKLKTLCPVAITLSIGCAGTAPAFAAGQITFVSQGGAYQEAQTKAILDPAAKELGITIKQDSIPDAWPQIKAQGATGKPIWDVVDTPTSNCLRGGREGLLEKLDFSKMPNAAAVPEKTVVPTAAAPAPRAVAQAPAEKTSAAAPPAVPQQTSVAAPGTKPAAAAAPPAHAAADAVAVQGRPQPPVVVANADPNAFNRLLAPPAARNRPPAEDGIHDAANPGTLALQPPLTALVRSVASGFSR